MERDILTIRNFNWEDIPAMIDLEGSFRQTKGETYPVDAKLFREHLEQPNLHAEENCLLYYQNGELKGYALIWSEPIIKRTVLELKIPATYLRQSAGKALLLEAIGKARRLGALVLHAQVPQDPVWETLFLEAGFSPVRDYWVMQWDPQHLPSIDLPLGFAFRDYGKSGDAEVLTQIQNSAFEGSWGFSPNTINEIGYRTNMSNTSHEGIKFLATSNAVAGYCWTFVVRRDIGTVGVISMIGIDPTYRQQRLGQPLLQSGLDYLTSQEVVHVELEVDGQNLAAIRLYQSVGFKKVEELHWFQSQLDRPC